MLPLDPLADVIDRAPDGAALKAAMVGPFRRAIRVHPRRGSAHGWGALTPVPWSASGFFHADDIDPGTRLDYHTGCAYPQDAASQLPVTLLAPQPGETIVDACAAPGSKSTQIGLALGDDGLVVCCDAAPSRRRVLAENLGRQGVTCALVTPMPLERLAEAHPGCADGVLVDAPCSGHEPRSAKQVARMAQVQVAIVRLAARLVRPGGRLVYSTCTPYPNEDENVVRAFLAVAPGWRIEAVSAAGCDPDLDGLGALRLWPHRQGTEPFFACRLRAPGEDEVRSLEGRLPSRDALLDRRLPGSPLASWRRGELALIGTRQVAACALPSEARGLILARGERLDPWGAQALIERGAAAGTVPHDVACALWGGAAGLVDVRDGDLLRTLTGAPLGVARDGGLDLPSRLRRAGLH